MRLLTTARSIVTKRLRLVPVTARNAYVLWRVLQQPDLRSYQDLPDVDPAHFKRIVAARPERLEAGSWGRFEWLIYSSGVEEPAGWISLRIGERASTSGEVGYSVVREQRGRGIATEAVSAMLEEGFDRLQLRAMRAYCMPDNAASRRVLEKVGFKQEGVLPRGAMVQGQPVDVLGFVIDRSVWLQSVMARRSTES
jgi:RimJ/RimL family protein N-acetyltransferase